MLSNKFKKISLLILFIVFIILFSEQPWFTNTQTLVIIAVMVIGFATFSKSKIVSENLSLFNNNKAQLDNNNIIEADQEVFEEVPSKTKKLLFLEKVKSKNLIYFFLLFVILFFFTVNRIKYFDLSFTGEFTVKYNTHVEHASFMLENDNPFWSQRKYLLSSIENPEGIRNSFGSLPVMEWGLLTTFYLFPSNTLELNTRIWMHFLGLTALFLIYIFLKNFVSKDEALLVTFLVSINPVFNLTFFVTVLDSLLIVSTFISLILLSKFIKTKHLFYLFLAGLISGVGTVVKYSVFLWLIPIAGIMLFSYIKPFHLFIKSFTIYIFLSIISIPVFRYSLRLLPSEPLASLLKFFVFSILLFFAFIIAKKYDNFINDCFDRLLRKKSHYLISILIVLVSSYFFIRHFNLHRLSGGFLTDSQLLFNLEMYRHMFNNQFRPYLTGSLLYTGLIGCLFTLLFLNRERKVLIISFITGSVVYWITASKSIYFHSYYLNIFTITTAIGCIFILILLKQIFPTKYFNFLFFFFILGVSASPLTVTARTMQTERQEDYYFEQLKDFLINNTKEHDIYIDDSAILTLTIHTKRGRIEERHLLNQRFIEEVRKSSFSEALEKFNIKFLITTNDEPRYAYYVNIFTDEELQSPSERRTDIIISELRTDYQFFQDMDLRTELIEKYNLKDKFILVEEIGPYNIFGFVN